MKKPPAPQDQQPLPKAVQELSETPAQNPRYRGATPADMARILLRKKPAADVADDLGAYANAPRPDTEP